MKYSEDEIKHVFDSELIAFEMTKKLSVKELFALERRIKMIARAISRGEKLPKESIRYKKQMIKAMSRLNFKYETLSIVK